MDSNSLATSPLLAASPRSFYEQIRDNTAYSVDFNHCDDSSSDIWSDDPTPNRQYEFQLINQLADSKYPLKTPSPTEPQDYHSDYSNDCMIHQEDGGKLYCETCTCIICGECSIGHHDDHTTLSLADAVNDAEAKANQVLKELNMTIDVLTKKLTTLQEDVLELNNYYLQSLDFLSTSLIKDTALDRSLAKKYLDETLNSRSKSFPAIEAKQEDLKTAIARLTGNARSITEAIEASKYVPNPLGVVITKDMAAAELFQLQQHIQKSLPAVNSLPSSGPEEIRPQSIWSPQAGRQILPQQTGCISPKFPVTRPTVGPMGRPIALNPFPVKVKCPANSRTAMPTKFTVIGNDGTNKSLCRPWGVACDKDGNILIADRSNHRILIYKEDGTFLREFGSRGSELGQFNLPAGITVDARRRIVVVDKDNHRVQMFTMNGKFLLSFGERGSQCGQFKYPWDVATNNDCQIAVTDTLNHRIQLFSPEGVFLRKFGYETNPRMLWVLDSPRGIAFNPRGDIVTTDFNNHRLVVIDYDFTYADIFECNTGGGETPFLRPQGLVVDDAGNIIVADCRNNRVVVLDPSGQLKWTFDCFHHGKETMDRPSGIAITRTGQIVVVDFGHDRALLF